MTIKQASEVMGISVDNLRYYERIGLENKENGYGKDGINDGKTLYFLPYDDFLRRKDYGKLYGNAGRRGGGRCVL